MTPEIRVTNHKFDLDKLNLARPLIVKAARNVGMEDRDAMIHAAYVLEVIMTHMERAEEGHKELFGLVPEDMQHFIIK